jgi:hypothetical protein
MKNINEVFIKISGKFPVDATTLEIGQDIELSVKGGIVKKEIYDNSDNSVDICFVVKPLDLRVI